MKKILKEPTVYRAKCFYCNCEFEYDSVEIDRTIFVGTSTVKCPGCNKFLPHEDSVKSTTEVKKEDTMTT